MEPATEARQARRETSRIQSQAEQQSSRAAVVAVVIVVAGCIGNTQKKDEEEATSQRSIQGIEQNKGKFISSLIGNKLLFSHISILSLPVQNPVIRPSSGACGIL